MGGDGFADLLFGAEKQDLAADDNRGGTFLVYGPPLDGDHSLTEADATFVGEAEGVNAGVQVTAAGDWDEDGYTDFLVMSMGNNWEGGTQVPCLHLVRGAPERYTGTLDLGSLPDRIVNTLHWGGGMTNERMGSVAAVGDFTGDGKNDLVIGAPTWESEDTKVGGVFGVAGEGE